MNSTNSGLTASMRFMGILAQQHITADELLYDELLGGSRVKTQEHTRHAAQLLYVGGIDVFAVRNDSQMHAGVDFFKVVDLELLLV